MPGVWQIEFAWYAELQSTVIDSSSFKMIPKPRTPFLCFAMITLAPDIRLLSFVPPLTFANTLALIPFPKWIGPYMV